MQKYFHCEAQSFHYNSVLHILTPPLSKTIRNMPAEEPKSHRCPIVRTQNQPYLYQIIHFSVNKNLHAIRHIFWQDCVKSGKRPFKSICTISKTPPSAFNLNRLRGKLNAELVLRGIIMGVQ